MHKAKARSNYRRQQQPPDLLDLRREQRGGGRAGLGREDRVVAGVVVRLHAGERGVRR